MTPTLDAIRKHKHQIEEIGERYGVSNVRIFGSVANGRATESSDLDLLVAIESGRSLLDIIGFEIDVSEMLGCPVDVVSERALKPALAKEVLQETFVL